MIISGTLHKQIFFVSSDEIVRHVAEDISFTTFADLPGVAPGDLCVIDPIIEHIGFELNDPVDRICADDSVEEVEEDECDDARDIREVIAIRPVFRRILQRTIIRLVVRGAQEVPIRVAVAAPLAAVAPVV